MDEFCRLTTMVKMSRSGCHSSIVSTQWRMPGRFLTSLPNTWPVSQSVIPGMYFRATVGRPIGKHRDCESRASACLTTRRQSHKQERTRKVSTNPLCFVINRTALAFSIHSLSVVPIPCFTFVTVDVAHPFRHTVRALQYTALEVEDHL